MTGPLIARDRLIDVLGRTINDPFAVAADALLDYLRSVLTPEALSVYELFCETNGSTRSLEGHDLHRRIFGEVR